MTDEYLELTPDEAITIFTSSGDFVFQLRAFCDSDLFFTLPAPIQELALMTLDRQVKVYEKVSMYLEKHGVSAMSMFNLDTKTGTPRGGI